MITEQLSAGGKKVEGESKRLVCCVVFVKGKIEESTRAVRSLFETRVNS